MIMEAPDDFDFDAAMARMATLPRQQEWEEYVGACTAVRPFGHISREMADDEPDI